MSEERLKRVEILLETCAKKTLQNAEQIERNSQQIDRLSEKIDRNSQQIDRLSEKIDRNSQQIASLSEMFTQSIEIMKNMQSEIKGLQTENKRILDHLFGEESD